MRKSIAVVLYVLAAVTFALAVSTPFRNPDPFTFQTILPMRAEVLPAEQVQPGTFKLKFHWNELIQHASAGSSQAIVSFGGNRGPDGTLVGFSPLAQVEAYLPRGDSTFYYAAVKHKPEWPYGFLVGRVERNGNAFTAYPAWSGFVLFISLLATALLVCVGAIVDPWPPRCKAS